MLMVMREDEDHFYFREDREKISPKTMVGARLRISYLPGDFGDKRVAVGDEVVLRCFDDIFYQFEFAQEGHPTFHISSKGMTGVRFTIIS
jgi:hypothetical protein